ncbi:MAG: hypothetical protein ACOX7H_00070 [Bacillota bacterium]
MGYYLFGVLAGLFWGGLVAALKYFFIWRPVTKFSLQNDAANAKKISVHNTFLRSFISYAVNILALFTVYYFRQYLPFSFAAVLIATAGALLLGTKISALKLKSTV